LYCGAEEAPLRALLIIVMLSALSWSVFVAFALAIWAVL
jgi:hypothetical protein